jgi:UDP-GlcNAc:undecaprenyl-phosphate GlcNAc-1-phosphate transferase
VLLHRPGVLMVSTALLGALIGFFRYNFRPARIFLGDSGSLFIGCLLALLSVYGIESGASASLAVAPIFALAIPLIDATLAFSRRWLRGVSFATADRRHLHHQLLAKGLSHLRAVIVLHVVALSLAIFGLMVAFAPATVTNVAVVGGGLLSVLFLLWTLGYLGYHEFSEAYAVVTWAPRRVRKVIRDQIHARDVAQVISVAGSLEEINAVLEDNASNFGFLSMSLGREGEPLRARPIVIENGLVVHPPKLEYPIAALAGGVPELVLRIWCRPDLSRPLGAERVAGILAPAIHDWLAERDTVRIAPPAAPPVGRVAPRG